MTIWTTKIRILLSFLMLAQGCGPRQPTSMRNAQPGQPMPASASASASRVPEPKHIEGPCEPTAASSAAASVVSIAPQTRATMGATRCRMKQLPLGTGLVGDRVTLGLGGAGAVACWPRDGDHVSVRLLDAEGNPRGPVWTSAPYPWLRRCDVLVGPKGALVMVHSGGHSEQFQWFGLFLDAQGTLIADALLDLDGDRFIDISATRDDGSYTLIQLSRTSKEIAIQPFALDWLEVSAAKPRACAAHIKTSLFSPEVHHVQWETGSVAALRFSALNRPDTHFPASWYTVGIDASVRSAAPPSPANAEVQDDGDLMELVFGRAGLVRIRGRHKHGALLEVPPELEPIDLRPFTGSDIFSAPNPVWTGRRYLVPLPMAEDGAASVLSVDCTPP